MQLPLLPPSLTTKKPPPQWDPFTSLVQTLSKRACIHPIHTIVIIALLASTTYVSILENSLFDRSAMRWAFGGSKKNLSLMDGSARVAVGEETQWKWKEIGNDGFEVRFFPFFFPFLFSQQSFVRVSLTDEHHCNCYSLQRS
jgi:hydroxymethylglutaryl-CoA reductase (NADPH)